MKMFPSHRRSGFTLIEVVVVIFPENPNLLTLG